MAGYRLRGWRRGQFRWSERRPSTIPTLSVRAGYGGDAEGGQPAAFSYVVALGVPPSPIVSLSLMVRRGSDTDAPACVIK